MTLMGLGFLEGMSPGLYRITQAGADFTHTTPVIIERLRASGRLG